jgi:hypothetical protein
MTVFDVFLNGEKLCRAGVGRDGVLNTIVTWVKLTGEAARTARRLAQPSEETRLHVGGLSKGTHWRWPERALKVGDTVAIIVGRSMTFDEPTGRKRDRPGERERQERRYYRRLKQKYEKGRGSSRVQRVEPDHETRFLNVDLDIVSSAPLDRLVNAFGNNVMVLHAGREGRQYTAHLELAASPRNADHAIGRFARLVEGLPRASRLIWNRARTRELSIGVQSGATPYSFDLRLQPETVLAAARVKARIGVTVYGASSADRAGRR